MPVPTECQALLSRWCAERVPAHARATLQIGYRIRGDEVTLLERRHPEFRDLNWAWSSRPVARLRYNDPQPGFWRLYQPAEDGWRCYDHPPSTALATLLAEIATDPRAIFWR